MANDVAKAVSSKDINNGNLINYCSKTGVVYAQGVSIYRLSQVANINVTHTPSMSEIENKYDNRFDDPSYYYGVGNNTVIGG